MPTRTFYCVLCGATIRGDESFYGTEFSCPSCNARVAIPQLQAASTIESATRAPSAPPLATSRSGDQPVATFAPVLRAYLGRLMFSVILALTAVVVAVLLRDHAPWQWVMAASLLAWALTVYLSTLWKCKSIRYQLSSQRLIITSGLLSKHVDELELFRVKDILVSQNIWQRLLNYGTITILSTDDTTPQLVMPHIHEPLKAKEVLREAYHEARRAANLRTTEFIQS